MMTVRQNRRTRAKVADQEINEFQKLKPENCVPGKRYLMPSNWEVTYLGKIDGRHYVEDRGESHLLGEDTKLTPTTLLCKETTSKVSSTQVEIIAKKKVPLSAIKPGRYAFRYGQVVDQHLLKSIQEYGVKEPLWVRSKGGDGYELLDGYRRFGALKELAEEDPRFNSVPVVVLEGQEEELAELLAVRNTIGKRFGPLSQAPLIQSLYKRGYRLNQISSLIGFSEGYLSDLKKIYQDRNLWTAVQGRDIRIGHARHLVRLGKAQRKEALEMVIGEALSVKETKALVEQWKGRKESDKLLQSKKEIENILVGENVEWKAKVALKRVKGNISFDVRIGFMLDSKGPLQDLILKVEQLKRLLSTHKRPMTNPNSLSPYYAPQSDPAVTKELPLPLHPAVEIYQRQHKEVQS